jgi:solute:Na+ symporter, SSS family
MNPMIIAVVIGLIFIAFLGFIGRKQSFNNNTGWTIGNRSMSSLTTFFLQAGGIFTSFTFLGMSGLSLLGGVSAAYMPAYLIIGYIGMFILGPLVWRVAKIYGYHTNADMVGHQFSSPLLGKLVAALAVVFFTPIVQVQIIGLGTIVSFSTGAKQAGTISMIIATILILAFLSWAGLRGIATTAYFKDVAMMVALAIILIGAITKFGSNDLMATAMTKAEHLFYVAPGTKAFGINWFVSSVIISGIGLGGMTLPESWPAVLSASKSRGVSKNHVLLPLYTLGTFIPIVLGFYAVNHLQVEAGQENSAILSLAAQSLPTWLMALIVISGLACAMVPAAHCVLSIATLVSTNFVPKGTSDEKKLKVGRIASSVILLLSLCMAIARPDLMANLYLLTYAGLAQLAPANMLAVSKQKFIGAPALLGGIIAAEFVVIFLTVTKYSVFGLNNGVVGLVINLIVMLIFAAATGPANRPELPKALQK